MPTIKLKEGLYVTKFKKHFGIKNKKLNWNNFLILF